MSVKNKKAPETAKTRKADPGSEPAEWFHIGHADGSRFARQEADYEELAAVVRAGGIPWNWDIFRAEILNRFMGNASFDFKTYDAGFYRACMEFFEKI